MKFIVSAVAASLLICGSAFGQQLAPSPTLDAVKARGHVECGVHLGLPGFSFANDKGEWSGIDVDYCKALAAAVLGDATKVKYTPTSVQQTLERLGRELLSQYKVVYGHPESLIPPTRFEVSARRPGITMRGSLVARTRRM